MSYYLQNHFQISLAIYGIFSFMTRRPGNYYSKDVAACYLFLQSICKVAMSD